MKTEDPVRSPELKHWTGRLVLWWVTTWESRLLYVLLFAPPCLEEVVRCTQASPGLD